MKKKVILITGASSGIGYSTAIYLAKEGHKVYTGARRMDKMESLKEYGITPVSLDVTDENSIDNALKLILDKENRIDALVNNAGYGSYGAIEDVPMEEARRQFEVNVFGLITLTKKVLPIMRKQHSGRIVNTSSMGGRLVSFMGGWYHATKYSVEALSDALRMETKQFGIDVVLIEPGGIKTDWGIIAAEHLEESSKGGAYEKIATKTAKGMKKQYSGNMLSDPKVISKAISKAINKRKPKTRYLVGLMAKPLVFFHTILPARAFDWIMKHAS